MDAFTSQLNLVRFARGGVSSSSVGIQLNMELTKYEEFITFLGIAQQYGIDFLPISWLPAMDTIGSGATAEIRLNLATYQVSFAFKRLTEKMSLQPLIAELQILGHPAVQKHPNILKLEGICWDIDKVGEVWPVLVFQKSQQLDLSRFMGTERGRQLSFESRLTMLADIASAIMTLHANGVVHGDLKPQNILIFCDENGGQRYVPKVADFGYSALIAKENAGMAIYMPGTPRWCSPEWYPGFATTDIMDAKRMDAYSFGLLCAWLLFNDTFPSTQQNFDGESHPNNTMLAVVGDLNSSSGISAIMKRQLYDLFDKTLVHDSLQRCSEFWQMMRLLSPKRYEIPVIKYPSQRMFFQISTSLLQLCICDYRVRTYIATCLHKMSNSISNESIHPYVALELTFCYKAGFGFRNGICSLSNQDVLKEDVAAKVLIKINDIKEGKIPLVGYEALEERAISSLSADAAVIYREMGCFNEAVVRYQEEIEDMGESFGFDHAIVHFLSAGLGRLLSSNGQWKEAQELEVRVMEYKMRVLGLEHPDTLRSIGQHAATYMAQGHWKKAEELNMQVMTTRQRVLGNAHSETLNSKGNLASTYRNQGRWKEAEELEVTIMETRKKVLGPDHPDTLTSTANLATTYRKQERWKEAEEIDVMVVEMSKRILGAEHPDTLTSIANLASTYWNLGRWKEAEELNASVLEITKRLFGEEHPDTLASMANLATTYTNLDQIEEIKVKVMETSKKVLGLEHPDTLLSMLNLASTYGNQGRWADAEMLELLAVETMKKVLGEEHPETLTAMANLAVTFSQQQRWKEAQELGELVMETRERVLGNGHPKTLTSMATLAVVYRKQKMWEKADKLDMLVIETTKRVMGNEHPNTLTRMASLARTFDTQGRWKEAEELYVPVMEIRKKVLGHEHPVTLASMGHVASIYLNQGRSKEAEELNTVVLETTKRVLGREHPDTLVSMANLASSYWSQGRWKEAEELEMMVIEIKKRVHGLEHHDTLASMGNLGATYCEHGRWKSAEKLQVQLVEISKRVLGHEHPDTLIRMEILAATYRKLGRLIEAEELEGQAVNITRRENSTSDNSKNNNKEPSISDDE